MSRFIDSGRKAIYSIKSREIKSTIILISIKITSILDLLKPQTIWGDRIGLRSIKAPLKDSAIKTIYQWSQDEEILRWTAGAPAELSLEDFRKQLHRDRWHPQQNQRLFYILTQSDELIGKIGLYSINWEKGEGELGISLDKQYWGKQYGRDAIKLLEWYIFAKTPISRIYLGTFKDNVRAQRAFAACGFRLIGAEDHLNPILGKKEEGVIMEIRRQDVIVSDKSSKTIWWNS